MEDFDPYGLIASKYLGKHTDPQRQERRALQLIAALTVSKAELFDRIDEHLLLYDRKDFAKKLYKWREDADLFCGEALFENDADHNEKKDPLYAIRDEYSRPPFNLYKGWEQGHERALRLIRNHEDFTVERLNILLEAHIMMKRYKSELGDELRGFILKCKEILQPGVVAAPAAAKPNLPPP